SYIAVSRRAAESANVSNENRALTSPASIDSGPVRNGIVICATTSRTRQPAHSESWSQSASERFSSSSTRRRRSANASSSSAVGVGLRLGTSPPRGRHQHITMIGSFLLLFALLSEL